MVSLTISSLERPNPCAPGCFPGLFFGLEERPFPAFFFGCPLLFESSFSEDSLPDSSFSEEALSDSIGSLSELSSASSSSSSSVLSPSPAQNQGA